MKKFIYSLTTFSLLVFSIYALISVIITPKDITDNDYLGAIIDKHDRINKLDCSKIIFAGGSNLAFGLNSESVENEFSVPVVNLGLHAGLGLNFIINELKSKVKNGDVVFLSIEYFLESEGEYKLQKAAGNIFEEAKEYYPFSLRNEILLNIDNTRKNISSLLHKKQINYNVKQGVEAYTRKSFNKYGDEIAHLQKNNLTNLNGSERISYSYWTGINELNDFYNYAKSKNVTVFFMYPNYPLTEFEKNEEAIIKLSNNISNGLNIEILNTPRDFVFADSLFFDTIYHLNKKGRDLRTKKIIDLINKSINAKHAIYTIQDKVVN